MRIALALMPVVALLCSGCIIPIVDLGSFGRTGPLVEHTLQGDSADKVVMLEIEGVIAFEEGGWSFTGAQPSVVARLSEALEMAEGDEDVKALILRIRSPGGSVAASETLHHLLSRFRKRSGKPVVAYLQGIAASGGYYIAMTADEVIAHPTAVTGSIGVVMPGVNVAGLMEQFGVENQTLTSGDFKDSGSMFRQMRADEREQLQSVVNDLYERFVEVVDEGRPKLDRRTVLMLADGRIYSAEQAEEAGLVDRVGHLELAVERAEALAHIEDAEVITYRSDGELAANVYSRFWSRSNEPSKQGAKASVISIGAGGVPAGFYYLWPRALDQ
jgi:protease-4